MNFYQQNKHLFEEDHEQPHSETRLAKLEQYLSKPKINQPVLKFQNERESAPQLEPPKTVFSQNARNLLGNYNDKYEAPSYDRQSYTNKRDAENRPTDKPIATGPINSDFMKAIMNPIKTNYDRETTSGNPLRDVDRYNPLSNYDANARADIFSSIPKPRGRAQNIQEDRPSYKETVTDNPYSYGAILGKNPNMFSNVSSQRSEPHGSYVDNQTRGRQNNSLDRYGPLKQNVPSLSQEWTQNQQNDSYRDRYNLQKGGVGQQSADSRNYLGTEDSFNENRNLNMKQTQSEIPLTNRTSHSESKGINQRTKEISSMKITSVDPTSEEKRHSRFPHEDYQVLKRKFGVKIESGTSDNNPFQTSKPQFLQNWQSKLSQLNSIRNRRTLPEALERRLLTSLIPDRKEQLRALLKRG